MTTPERGTEGDAVRRHIDKLVEGIRAADLEALRPLFAPDMVSFDIEPPLQHVGVEAKLKNWTNAFARFQAPINYEVRDLAVTVGGDVAYVHGFARLSGTLQDGTVTPGMWVRYTGALRKVEGEWLIAHDQVSVPFDLPTGKGVTDLEP